MIEKRCTHSWKDECQCSCHIPNESGEPAIIHMFPCCEKCEHCGRWIDKQLPGITC